MWKSQTPKEKFIECVRRWLDLSKRSSRLVLAPGDQVSPETDIYRIEMVHALTEKDVRH